MNSRQAKVMHQNDIGTRIIFSVLLYLSLSSTVSQLPGVLAIKNVLIGTGNHSNETFELYSLKKLI